MQPARICPRIALSTPVDREQKTCSTAHLLPRLLLPFILISYDPPAPWSPSLVGQSSPCEVRSIHLSMSRSMEKRRGSAGTARLRRR